MIYINKKDQNGFTLTELMVTTIVIGLLTIVVSSFLIGGLKFYRLSTAKGEIQRNARNTIDIINRNLRQAQGDTITISRYDTSQPFFSKIEFTDINGNKNRFYQLRDKLFVGKKPSGAASWTDNQFADSLRVLTFAYPRTDDDTIVSVSLCFEKATYQGATKALQLSVEKVRIMN
jgi:prepilin-type N-terminal cleavage/methylation domain-containing protein